MKKFLIFAAIFFVCSQTANAEKTARFMVANLNIPISAAFDPTKMPSELHFKVYLEDMQKASQEKIDNPDYFAQMLVENLIAYIVETEQIVDVEGTVYAIWFDGRRQLAIQFFKDGLFEARLKNIVFFSEKQANELLDQMEKKND